MSLDIKGITQDIPDEEDVSVSDLEIEMEFDLEQLDEIMKCSDDLIDKLKFIINDLKNSKGTKGINLNQRLYKIMKCSDFCIE